MDYRVSLDNHSISMDIRMLISTRYKTITKAVNRVFWETISETAHSRYVGSYGRGTAINTSDLDVLMELPIKDFSRFNSLLGNGPSRLLQAVRNAIITSYPNTNVAADGQVVVVTFSDDMKFEILPAFLWDKIFIYPDSNMGGNWLSTNPIAEQDAMKQKNEKTHGLLFDTCKHIRYIRDSFFSSYHLSGILIDSFVFSAIGNWHWCQSGEASSSPGTYEQSLFSFYKTSPSSIHAPGSDIPIRSDDWNILGKVLNKMVQS